jgi:peptidoglycan hydrolase-like protein with peptidoglycan-binding domain/uncharacterized protein (UPF0332 family)
MQPSVLFLRVSMVTSVVLSVLLLVLLPSAAKAAPTECSFSQTLEMGVIDESVRCLQQYLNATGFEIASEGPGSPGNETNKYGLLTEAAVVKWQEANGVYPAMGIFGPVSQAAYRKDAGSTAAPVESAVPSSTEEDLATAQAELDKLLQMALGVQASGPSVSAPVIPVPQVAGVSTDAKSDLQESAESFVEDAMDMILDTYEELENIEEDDPEEAADIRGDLRGVLELLFGAIEDYFDGDFSTADEDAAEALDDATDAYEDAGGESPEREAEDVLDDVNDLYDELGELLEEAEDRDERVGDAPGLLKKAKNKLDDAEHAFAERVYRQAISDAFDAEELLEEARDEIDILSDNDVERLVVDLWDEYADAENEIDEAEDNGEEVEESKDKLDKAERRLKKADYALDDGDYEEARGYADEAESYIEDARDEIGRSGSDDEESEAEDALKDAEDEIDNAWGEVYEAEDRGESTRDAEELLEEAEDLLKDAEKEFDKEDYGDVLDLVDEIEELVEEALDEL